MLVHLFNLILRSIEAMPVAVGSNWLGILYPLLLFVATQGISVLIFGWDAVKRNWGKTVGVGFSVVGVFWIGLFLWCAMHTTFDDHVQLVKRVSKLHESLASLTAQDTAQISELRQDCAFKDGQNQTLLTQNRDQQNSINGCLAQAIKLVTVPPFLVKADVARIGFPDSGKTHIQGGLIVLSTNRTIAAYATITCSQDFDVVGYGSTLNPRISMWDGPNRASKKTFPLARSSPAWDPSEKFVFLATYKIVEGADFACTAEQANK